MPRPALSVLPGTVTSLALSALEQGGRMHGFEVLSWLETQTDGQLLVEEGALYPALHRLEKRGLIRGDWGISEKGRRAKYYTLTAAGRKELARERVQWARYAALMDKVMAPEAGS
ncbi:MAG: PadR family transcriptional regulator [Gemmatimonadota bacterium]